jgi:hypothetical protein
MRVSLSRTRAPAAIAAIVLGAVGCASSTNAEPSPSGASHSVPTPPRSSSALTGCGNYEAHPLKSQPLPDQGAPAYAGEGPHRAVVGEDVGENTAIEHLTPSTFSLPNAWQALNAKRTEPDPSRAELLVCLSQVKERSETRIGTCAYSKGKAYVYPADYTFDIYTARTGRRVSRVTIAGDESAPVSCPQSVLTVEGVGFRVAQRVSDAAFSSGLRTLITGPAR